MQGRREDRRQSRNDRIAEVLAGTEHDRRSHSDADCVAIPVPFGEASSCRTCGRPMTAMEILVYRAL